MEAATASIILAAGVPTLVSNSGNVTARVAFIWEAMSAWVVATQFTVREICRVWPAMVVSEMTTRTESYSTETSTEFTV